MSVFGPRTFVIAEAGVNHNGNMDYAHRLIDAAVEAGADAVKFQTFTLAGIVSPDAPMAEYQKAACGDASQADMLQSLELSFDQFAQLADYASRAGIMFLSTAFDLDSLAFLHELNVPVLKVPSGEITNPELVQAIGRCGIPVIMSTGMASLGEVETALNWLAGGCLKDAPEIALLHCVSDYPADPADCNLAAMDTLAAAFGLPVGWSDHTLGDTVTIAAVARGARIVEKHLTLDNSLPGPDHKASLDPAAMKRMVENIRITEQCIGNGRKVPCAKELKVAQVARRSIVARRAIAAGAVLTTDDLAFLRPGTGIAPGHAEFVLGRTARQPIPAGAVIRLADLA